MESSPFGEQASKRDLPEKAGRPLLERVLMQGEQGDGPSALEKEEAFAQRGIKK